MGVYFLWVMVILQSPTPAIGPSAPDCGMSHSHASFAEAIPFAWNAVLALSGKLLLSLQVPIQMSLVVLSLIPPDRLLFPVPAFTVPCLDLICCPVLLYYCYFPWLLPSPNCEILQGQHHRQRIHL